MFSEVLMAMLGHTGGIIKKAPTFVAKPKVKPENKQITDTLGFSIQQLTKTENEPESALPEIKILLKVLGEETFTGFFTSNVPYKDGTSHFFLKFNQNPRLIFENKSK